MRTAHRLMFEYLVSSWQNCLGKIRCDLVGTNVPLGAGFEVSEEAIPSVLCLLLAVGDGRCQLSPPPCVRLTIIDSNPLSITPIKCFLKIALAMVFYHRNRTVTNTTIKNRAYKMVESQTGSGGGGVGWKERGYWRKNISSKRTLSSREHTEQSSADYSTMAQNTLHYRHYTKQEDSLSKLKGLNSGTHQGQMAWVWKSLE